ncbi:PDR/VanB family oxidoreductase [Rhodococcus sp. T7]|uniref:PDR/VanB family oxidoreductase n=1 Tax=Rhodococcus sp. T7 TaxID=627444 RepID=UPI0013CAFCE1|nr:PDR/VanB family oxidoreductase [Rhodococcus sp. T7]KAF0965642.1 Phenoxybenzoate dioxygenase subunit beta [Rhodococcus sp. T7]
MHTELTMRVDTKTLVADDVVLLGLSSTDGSAAPRWQPGAHIDLTTESGTVRQYSLCGDVEDPTSLAVAVLREADGRGGSIFLHDTLEAGDVLSIGGPRNHFELIEAESYLFVAGGIGITPMVPMIRSVAERNLPWRLLYGGRSRSSMAFVDVLEHTYADQVAIWPQDERGLLDLGSALDVAPSGTAVYCCGPGPLLDAVESACVDRPVSLHMERFSPKATSGSVVDAEFDVELARSGTTLTVGANETILDALLRNDIDVDYSCREGTCGTCEVAVCAGIPDHRDSVLDNDEQDANDTMMICVSRSRTPRLTLDV